ncbi:MAG: hypothetical protein B6D64_00750 [Bacteroidetes bacterium 4484_276]|nr:MAG: hypothetical protein B6D64_00750 [Bacteroidetes bacterium 4484_276]OYT12585.1 MAG: hypothetical protein B6I19_09640 [Bacteroidetes bacterium 4572_114]
MLVRYFSAVFLIFIIALLVVSSCKKEDTFDTNPSIQLGFSLDTLIFDTVFSTIGSATQTLRVYNPSDNKVKISNIHLASGSGSRYSINVDGISGTSFDDVEIRGNDSMYIFVRVTIDPQETNLPFVVTDSIFFETNGNEQDVDLVAWGQNARFILWDTDRPNLPKYKIVAGEGVDTTWTSDLPIVVYGYAVVDSTGSLTIDAGSRIYFHKGSGLWIYKGGSLKVQGTMEGPVYFDSDRLESFYSDLPGQWDRIWINEGAVDNEINYAVIRNGFVGIQAETLQEYMGNQLNITNTIIENMSGAGILTRYYHIVSYNCVIANCGQYAVALTLGGSYDFRQTTIANYWNYNFRQTQSVVLNNYIEDNQGVVYAYPFSANFANTIIYGNQQNEFVIDENTSEEFILTFDHCLLKTDNDLSNTERYINCLKNEDPFFVDYAVNNYELDSLSPAKNIGSIEIANTVPFDIKGVNRTESPDLGAYEWVQGEGGR